VSLAVDPENRSAAPLQQDLERQARRAAAPQEVPGLSKICVGAGKVAGFCLGEPELTKLLDTPPVFRSHVSTTTASARAASSRCSPRTRPTPPAPAFGTIERDLLGGLVHEYHRAAAWTEVLQPLGAGRRVHQAPGLPA
jgi:hypothetical protein